MNKQSDGIAFFEQKNVLYDGDLISTGHASQKSELTSNKSSTRGINLDRTQNYLLDQSSCYIQYLDLKFCNFALSDMIQCELSEVDFSMINKRSSLKKAGPDLCF